MIKIILSLWIGCLYGDLKEIVPDLDLVFLHLVISAY